MSNETRLDRFDATGRLLLIVRDALAPTVWEHRHRDRHAYVRVQEQRTNALSAVDLRVPAPHKRNLQLEHRILSDPQKLLRLLKLSPRLRAEIFGAGDSAREHVIVLVEARKKWAHGGTVSQRDFDRAFASAESLMRAAGAAKAIEDIIALRWRGLGEWPKDAA